MSSRFFTVLALLILPFFSQAQTQVSQEPVLGFEVGASLQSRYGLYYRASTGKFYGTSSRGGAYGAGTVFEMDATGAFQNLSFSAVGEAEAFPGAWPMSELAESSDGWLWTTVGNEEALAAQQLGSIVRLRPETGECQVMARFTGNTGLIEGSFPQAGLVNDGNGFFWGSTMYSNAAQNSGLGTLFKINEITGQFTKMFSFTGGTGLYKGKKPVGTMYKDGSGNLWGVTEEGGALDRGTIFKYDIASGTFTNITDFSGSTSPTGNQITGTFPNSRLVPDGAGYLWGTTRTGATNGNGTIFKVEMATGTATHVTEFNNNGAIQSGMLTPDGQGYLWGFTNAGGTSNKGTIFKIEAASGTLTTVLQFATLSGTNAGISGPSSALVRTPDGYMWGTAGTGTSWIVYKLKISDNTFTKVAEGLSSGQTLYGKSPLAGVVGSEGSPWLWGTTSSGGNVGLGTLYRVNPESGQVEVLKHFTGTSGSVLGSKPSGKLTIASNGVLWGTTEEGGTGNFGTIFKYDPSTATFSAVYSFTANGNGASPLGLTLGANGVLWGVARSGSDGILFSYNPSTNVFTKVYGFTALTDANALGRYPDCKLVSDGNGYLWGATTERGQNNDGTIFKVEEATGTVTLVYRLNNDSALPLSTRAAAVKGELYFDGSGYLWGMWGNEVTGGVFRFNTATSTFENVFVNQSSSYPYQTSYPGTLGKATNGTFWFAGTETTQATSAPIYATGRDVVWQIDPTAQTPAATKRWSLAEGLTSSFAPSNYPTGALYEHSDGYLYGVNRDKGTTRDLRPAGGGMLYRIRSGPAVTTMPIGTAGVFSSVSGTTATLRANVNPNGLTVTPEFEWGPTSALGQVASASAATPGSIGSIVTGTVTGLAPATTYYYRSRVQTETGYAYGNMLTFLTGSVTAVQGPEIAVESPLAVPLVNNSGTVSLGRVPVGQNRKQPVVVRNEGQSTLSGLTASISGSSDFTIVSDVSPTSLLSTFHRAGLMVLFTPSGAGVRTATLTITSNDSNEGSFEIHLSAEGVVEPDIEVTTNGGAGIEVGSWVDFGSTAMGVATNQTLLIKNVGNATLTGISFEIIGSAKDDYGFGSVPGASLLDGGSSNLILSFTPSEMGARDATLRIRSDDPDESVYEIKLTGKAISAPEIVVEYPAQTDLTDGVSTVSFGNVPVGASVTRELVIKNIGSAPLTGVSASVVGQPQYVVTTAPLATIAPGSSSTCVITLTPLAATSVIAQFQITSNDSDENPFNLTLSGAGTTSPEISVEVGATVLIDGESELDYGMVNMGATGSKTITIKNLGNTTLNSLAVNIGGADEASFFATALSQTSLAPNGSVAFVLTFSPDAERAFASTLQISSNDADEASFDVGLTGEGVMPQSPLFPEQELSRLVLIGDTTTFEPEVNGAVPLTFQWRKNGTVIRNATQASFTVSNLSKASIGAYSLLAENSEGSSTSSPFYLGAVMLRQGSLPFKVGTKLTLKNTSYLPQAAGVSYRYQWKRSGNVLQDGETITGSEISGASSPVLTVNNLQVADSGNYTCVVTMMAPDGTDEIADGDTVVQVVEKPVFEPIELGPTNVAEAVHEVIEASFSPTKYSAKGLPPGVKLNAVTGELTGAPTASRLVKGVLIPYQVIFTATNLAGSTSTPVLDWLVNPLPVGVVGTFNGLVARNALNASVEGDAGLGGSIKVVTTSSGSLSGTLKWGALSYGFKGVLVMPNGEGNPTAEVTIPRKSPLEPLELSFTVNALGEDPETSGRLAGSVSADGAPVTVDAWLASTTDLTLGLYNLALRPSEPLDPEVAPAGFSYATLKVGAKGAVTWTGLLADGTKITGSNTTGPSGQISLYQLLYKNTGSLQVAVTADPADGVDGAAEWLKYEQTKTRSYADGFYVESEVTGGLYIPQIISADLTLKARSGGLESTLEYPAAFDSKNVLIVTDEGEKFSLKLNVKTGLITGSFEQPGTPKVRKAVSYATWVPGLGGIGFFLLPEDTSTTSPIYSGALEIHEESDL